ncbi:hypothetical protein FT663_02368 [Candidozyma haemuli var. vulneris]|uniref:aspartate transaminase n=1 Tax=Candidozyma haemuli TaxID=45357 RepID=A0A2V1ANA0_9ASCO|nr:hypothetical protein CXQ85_000979 [[Candida] haemuloni]KAF3985933.1 hypothetical protein FT662_04860 [[Candida] haemuloni var. vulneris]KAF3992311.1 hypothetical protein FT663_02368 [[Candida] haemuloni var. vulneris]PVH18693.1 hypothetical protein CXQ85_000979 [[Candida] haemuloni]
MTVTSYFSSIEDSPPDPIAQLMELSAKDPNPNKIDVSIGVYKSEEGDPNYVFPCVRQAKEKLAAKDPGHCYTNMTGIPAFRESAQRTIFGENHDNIISLQAISGSGSLHFAFAFLTKYVGLKDYYVGVPAWGNYTGMIEHIGGNVHNYKYYDNESRSLDFNATLEALKSAPANSVFVLQAVCHNPTGCDYTREQWSQILALIQQRDIFPVFDIAYQGFASGSVDEDAWVIREAYKTGVEFMVCQSFSKNLALYSERAGCLHVVLNDKRNVENVTSQLTSLARHEISFAPAFGARVATLVQTDEELQKQWKIDVADVYNRIKSVRQHIYDKLNELKTPGNWDHVITQKGLFCFTGLSPLQVQKLISEHSIYLTANGRINIAGLNQSNLDDFCKAVDTVIRQYPAEK